MDFTFIIAIVCSSLALVLAILSAVLLTANRCGSKRIRSDAEKEKTLLKVISLSCDALSLRKADTDENTARVSELTKNVESYIEDTEEMAREKEKYEVRVAEMEEESDRDKRAIAGLAAELKEEKKKLASASLELAREKAEFAKRVNGLAADKDKLEKKIATLETELAKAQKNEADEKSDASKVDENALRELDERRAELAKIRKNVSAVIEILEEACDSDSTEFMAEEISKSREKLTRALYGESEEE